MPRMAFQCWGDSTYSVGGEPYAQIPRRLLGKLSRSAQLVLDALLEALGSNTVTDIRDKDIAAKTGLHLRTIQRALFMLDHVLKAIIRKRSDGRRDIELKDRLASSREDVKTEKVEATTEAKAKVAEEVKRAISDMAAIGWTPVNQDGKYWARIPGVNGPEPDQELRDRLRRLQFEIRALVMQQGRPAKE